MKIKLDKTETELMLDVEDALGDYCEQLEALERREESGAIISILGRFCDWRSKLEIENL